MAEEPGPKIIEPPPPLIEAEGFSGYHEVGGKVLPKRAPRPEEERRITEHVVYEIEAVCGLIRTLVSGAATDVREFTPVTPCYFRALLLPRPDREASYAEAPRPGVRNVRQARLVATPR